MIYPASGSKLARQDNLILARNALLMVSGVLGVAGLARFLNYPSQSPSTTVFSLGPALDYAMGTRNVLSDIPAVLIRSEKGSVALNLVCPNLGCNMENKSDGVACPCHRSRFDSKGNVTHGPAGKALSILPLETKPDGKLYLYTD
jgi:cytochrome b6-f complex iron-sulfur subunit